jgi:hypothetical protein
MIESSIVSPVSVVSVSSFRLRPKVRPFAATGASVAGASVAGASVASTAGAAGAQDVSANPRTSAASKTNASPLFTFFCMVCFILSCSVAECTAMRQRERKAGVLIDCQSECSLRDGYLFR